MEVESAGSETIKDHSGLTMDEKIASLFQPDTLLPAQYYGNLRRRNLLQPEMQLTLAILEDAINCFQENLMAESVKGKKLFNEAEEWILDEDGDTVRMYYGAADSTVCVATASVRELLEHLSGHPTLPDSEVPRLDFAHE